MKQAIALAGGGTKGAYQVGAWKAMRELGIPFDIVTGTSIGSVTAALMVQDDFDRAWELWTHITEEQIMLERADATLHEKRELAALAEHPEQLVARVRALTRRQGDVVIDEVTFGDLTLDLSTHDLTNGDYTVHLSKKEFEVMQILMSSNGRIVSKQDLLTRVWSTDGETSENSVEAYISFLRKKLSHIHSVVQITTLRMLGYRLEAIHPDATR